MVIKAYPITDGTAGVLDALEALSVRALFFKCTNDAFDHAVLLWAMGRDELLAKTIAAYQGGVVATGKHQPIVRSK